MNKKAIVNAYDSYLFAKKAMTSRKWVYPEEKDVLEILSVLSESCQRKVFTFREIAFVSSCLFCEGDHEVLKLLHSAEEHGKVISFGLRDTDTKWKLVPMEKDNK